MKTAPPEPLELEEAQARLLALVTPLPLESVPVAQAAGRFLARPLLANRDQPAADLSAMDGYACAGEGPWRVIGESAAGHPFAKALKPGDATNISTGAVLPEGADRIVLREWATLDGDRITSDEEPQPGRFVRPMASDFTAGDLLAEAGARADARLIALALAAGHATLDVPRLPAITCLDTGDELAPPGEKTDPHRIPASNGAMIAALAAPLTRTIDLPPPVPDDRAALVRALHEAERHDVIVTSGGASVGEHDHLQDAVREWGGEITFWRVAIKPGKPLLIAQKSGCLLIGLPGNPVSGYVTALLFLIPVLRALAGCNAPLPPTRRAVMACDLPAGGGRREFLRMRMTPAGLVRADSQDSAALRSLAMADALLDRAAHAPPAAIGDECSIIDLTGSPFA